MYWRVSWTFKQPAGFKHLCQTDHFGKSSILSIVASLLIGSVYTNYIENKPLEPCSTEQQSLLCGSFWSNWANVQGNSSVMFVGLNGFKFTEHVFSSLVNFNLVLQ